MRFRLAEHRRQSRWSTYVFGLFLVLSVVVAITGSAWSWVGVLFWAGLIAMTVTQGRRLERTRAELGDSGADVPR